MNEKLKNALNRVAPKTPYKDDIETWNVHVVEGRHQATPKAVEDLGAKIIQLDQYRPHEVTIAAQTARQQVDQHRAEEQQAANTQNKDHNLV